MANIKSAKKRILVNETKAARNKAIKSKVKTCVKKVETAVAHKDAAAAAEALRDCYDRDQQSRKQGCLSQEHLRKKDFPFSKSC